MSRLTQEESRLFQERETILNTTEQGMIEHVLDVLNTAMWAADLKPKGDDRAARLEAALIRYIVECRE